ncbi:hypothetical protein ACOTEY_06160 [Achromobacter xylosoxidans]|uniref:hypothetical protein n=1 Tax=Alcaligenes xylosoxydans xylosoxydans TaxID=85698 RepID=UPI001EEBFBF1|nr:hypothetical protein [Achromobacter xylosoxidans]MCM2572444.1 hypothetical protein [Achromobacter xylosoxidans]WOB76936.1 hypothetical protein PZA07_16125 [Achromobacter xylosoxidans]
MTTISSYTPPLVIAPQAPATGVSRVTTVNRSPDIPASTSVTLGQPANVLTYSPESVAAGQVQEPDALSSLMSDNVRAASLTGQFKGLAAALLGRMQNDGGNYALTIPPARAAAPVDGIAAPQGAAVADNSVALRITTASGAKVTVTLESNEKGLGVQIDVGDAKLTEEERSAIAGLSKSFQDAVDGLASVPPKLALGALAKFNTSVLSSVSLEATVGAEGPDRVSFNFQADAGQRSLTVKTVAGSAQINVDASQPSQFGSAQQQTTAINNYLSKFDSAQKRGEGDATLMALFKSGFADLHKSYGDWAPQGTATTRLGMPAEVHRTMLSGLADFSASINQAPVASNPLQPREFDTFSYETSQNTTSSGRPQLDLAITQQQQSSLNASFHRALSPDQKLNLTKDPESQNYAFHQIRDDYSNRTDIAYEDGELAKASFTESSTMSTLVSKFVKGKLVDQSRITPTTQTRTQDLMGLLRAADLTSHRDDTRTPRDQVEAALIRKQEDLAQAVARLRG